MFARQHLNPFSLLQSLYHWTMRWAAHKYNVYALGFLSAIESIFFPIPVDPLLMAMGVTNPRKAIWYGVVTTVFSVVGACLGYWIGAMFWEATQGFFLTYVFSEKLFAAVVEKFNENAVIAILLASFTPLPYKVFTVTAGVAQIPLIPFILSSLVGRGMRFIAIGALVYFFGEPIKAFIDKYFNAIVVAIAILLVGGYYLIPVLFN